MRKLLLSLVVIGFVAGPLFAQVAKEDVSTSASEGLLSGVAQAVELIKAQPYQKTLFYMERHANAGGREGPVLRFDVVSQFPGLDTPMKYPEEDLEELTKAITVDFRQWDENGWDRIAIIVDGEIVTVAPGPGAGSFETFPARMRALVSRVFEQES